MRFLCPTGALIAAVAALLQFPAVGQNATAGLSIVNYQFVNDLRATRTQWYVTYRADLKNTGGALPGVTATVRSKVPTVSVVPGQNILHFAPVGAGSITPTAETFTILVDRSVPFDFSTSIEWSFNNPVANAGPPQTVGIGSTVLLNGGGSSNPSGLGTLTYSWSFVSRPPGSAAVLHDAGSARASFVVDAAGDYVLQLVVNNGIGSDSARTVVSTGNSAPVANAGQSQSATVGDTKTLDGSKSTDVDGDTLSYFWTLLEKPSDSSAFIANARSVMGSILIDKPGSYLVQLVVNDGKVDSAPAAIRITTSNTAPVANAGPDQSVDVGSFVQLTGAGSTDVDGDRLTYKWTFVAIPDKSTAVLSSIDAVKPSFTADVPGTYRVQLVVNDGKLDSAPAVVAIQTNALQRPTADAGPNQTVVHGTLVTLAGKGSDPQGLPLTYLWSLITRPPGSAAKLSAVNIPSPTFTADVPGQYVAQLIVSSPYLSSTPPANVTITTTNTAPVASAGPDTVGIVGSLVQLDGSSSSDADNDALSYSWSLTKLPPGSSATLSSPNSAKPTFVPDVAGDYVAQLIVSDKYASSAPATVSIAVDGLRITLSPNPLELATGPGTLTINVSVPSPTGLEVTLKDFDPAVISVPSTVIVQPNATGANVQVTPLKSGATNILASAPGYQPGSAAVHVTTPGIVVTLAASGVGVGRSIGGTVAISSPAPSGGTIVTLSASPGGRVTLSPTRLLIGPGNRTADFTVTGVSNGSVTITATADLFASGQATLLVADLGAISLGQDKTVAPGKTVDLALSLSSPAPTGGVLVDLTSSDTSKAKVPLSVFIEQGATAPATQPQVSGVDFGAATITASSAGYTSANVVVKVAGSLSFQPSTVTFASGETERDVVVALSAPTPSGVTVNLAASPAGVVTVPASVSIPANSSSVHVLFKAAGAGAATVTATTSTPNVSSGTASVTISSAGSISLAPVSLTLGGTADLQITLSTPAPGSGLTVALSSTDDSKVGVGSTSVTIPGGAIHPTTAPKLVGNGPGTATVRATAPAWGTGSQDVSVSATLSFTPASLSLSGSETKNLTLTLSGPAPTGGLPVSISSSSTSVAKVGAGTVTIPAGGTTATVAVTGVGAGSAAIKASAASIPDALANVTVTASIDILIPATFVVAPGESKPFPISLAKAATAPISIDLTNSDATKATLSQTQLSFNVGQTEPTRGVNITGVARGTTMVTAKAAGLSTAVSQVTVGVTATLSPSDLLVPIAGDGTLTITLSSPAQSSVTFTVASSDQTVATAPNSVLVSAGATSVGFKVTPKKAGTTAIRVTAPNFADMTSNITVGTPGNITLSAASSSIQLWQSVNVTITLSKPAPASGAVVTLTTDTSKLALSQSTVTIPSGSSTASVTATGINVGSPTISATSPAFNAATPITIQIGATIEWVTPTLTIVGIGQQAWLELKLYSTVPGSPAFSLKDGIVVNLTSSRPDVASVPLTATFYWDGSTAPILRIPVTSVAPGTAVIHASGINIADVAATVTVNGPLAITPMTLPNGMVGTPYSATVVATGGTPPYHWSATGLPAPLKIDPLTGKISGTPAAKSTSTVIVSVSDSAQPTAATANITLSLTIDQAPASIAVAAGSGQKTAVNTRFATPLQAIVKDAGGNPVAGVDVTFTPPASGPGGAFTGATTVKTDASGIATAPAFSANTVAGDYSVTAAAGALSVPFSLTNNPGDPASLTVQSGSPQTAAIETAFATPFAVVLKDTYGNRIKGATVTFTAPAQTGPSGTFAGGQNTAVTDATGVATAVVFTANTKAGTYSVLAKAGAPSATLDLTNAVGSPASVTVTAGSPQSAPITKPFANPLQVLVKDKGGNPVSDWTVTFVAPATGASATFAGGVFTAKTNASGYATSAAVSANSTVGAYVVTAKTGADTDPSATLSLTNTVGPPANISVTAGSPQSASVNTAFATQFQVLVKDAGQNPIPDLTVTFTVNPSASGAGGAFATGATATAKTNASGVATAPVFTANGKADSYTVSAAAGTVSALVNLTNTLGNPSSITVSSGSGQSATVGTAFASPLKALVKDSSGNPIPGITVTFTAPPATGPSGSFAGGVNTAVTDASGVATSTVFTANTKAPATGQPYTVTASTNGLSALFSMTNLAGPASSLTVSSGSPQSAVVNTQFAAPLKASISDSYGNPVKNADVVFTPPATGASASFAGGVNTAKTDASGIATSAALTANTSAGSYAVKAASGALTANFQLTNTIDGAASIAVQGGSGQTAIVGAGFTNPLTAIVKDKFGNPVKGVLVTFAAPTTGASVTFAGGVNTATTDDTGVASRMVTANTKTGANYTVNATVSGVAAPAAFTLTNSAGPVASLAIDSGSPQSAVVNKAFGAPLKVIAKDSFGNPVGSASVTFTLPTTGAGGTFAGGVKTVQTAASGIATSATLTANTTAGPFTVVAQSGAASVNLSLTNVPDAVASIAMYSGSPQSTVVGTAFSAPLKAIVKDQYSNVIQGVTVTFTAPTSGPGATFATNPATAVTDANGIATSPVVTANNNASSTPYDASATTAGFVAKFSLTNTPETTTAGISVVSGSNQTAEVNTNFAAPLKVVVKDSRGNPIANDTVTFTAPTTGASGAFSPAAAVKTDASGFASVTFKANTVAGGPYSVTAKSALSPSTTATFTLTNKIGQPASITVVSGSPQSAAKGAAFSAPLKAVVKDAFANVVPNAAVTFTAPTTGATATFTGGLASVVVNTDNSGVATSPTLTANNTIGSYTVTATIAALSTTFGLTNNPGQVATVSIVSGSPQSAVVKTAFALPLKVVAKDAGGDPVPNTTVTFTVPAQTGPSGTFAAGITAVTNASGEATSSTFTANEKAGAYSVDASVGAVKATFSLTNTPGPALVTAQAPTTQGTPNTTAFPSPLTALVADSFGNPISGVPVTFTAPTGAGVASADLGGGATKTVTSNSSGLASVTATANNVVGTYNVVASIAPGKTTTFQLTNQTLPLASLTITAGSPQTTIINSAFATQLQVVAKDAGGNPLRGIYIIFTAPKTTVAATGSFSPATDPSTVRVPTDSLGIAMAPVLTANNVLGNFIVVAAAEGYANVTPVNFVLKNVLINGAIGITDATIGKNLQTSINITFSPAVPAGGITLTLTSADQTKALIGNSTVAGIKTLVVPVSAGTTALTTTVQALTDTGTTTITASAGAAGYTNGVSTITFAPSGFVIASPNGVGAAFTASQGTTTTLTVKSARLDGAGLLSQAQQIRGGFSVNVPVAIAGSAVGTLSASSVAISGGSDQGTVDFVASGDVTGTADVIVSPPPTGGFASPSSGTSVTANVLKTNMIPFTATVGQKLEKAVHLSITGTAPADTIVTLSSPDARLKFSAYATDLGSSTLDVVIPMNFSSTPDFYIQGFASSGSIQYTATSSRYGSVSGTVSFAPATLIIESPGGVGATSFTAPITFSPANLTMYLAAGAERQLAAGGVSFPIALSSNNTSVATLNPANITIAGGSPSASTLLNFVAQGTATVTATSGTLSAQVTATITDSRKLLLDTTSTSPLLVGNRLAQPTSVHLIGGAAGPGGVDVLVQTSAAGFQLALANSGAGSNSIIVNVPEGSSAASFWVYGAANSGTFTYTATATSYDPATGYVTLAPSGVVFTTPSVLNRLTTQTTAPMQVAIGPLNSGGAGLAGYQRLAGGGTLDVQISSDNPSIASVPSTITIPAQAISLDFSATLHAVRGTAHINLGTPPAGFSAPAASYVTTTINVN